jgi:hypothetical protein
MRQTCRGDTRLLISLDADDPAYQDYPLGPLWQTLWGVRGVVGHFNAAATGFGKDFRFIGALGDDFLPGTDAWDTEIMEALDETPFAYGNERFPGRAPGESICHIFTRAEVVEALGYVGPPQFRHMYIDNAWAAWGKACGVTYLDGTVLEHLHPNAGKASHDETYARSAGFLGPDREAWDAYQAGGLQADIEKIKAVT